MTARALTLTAQTQDELEILSARLQDATARLKELAAGDPRVAQLLARYHELSGEIRLADENVNATDDTIMESMKRQRLAILDDLRATLDRA